VEGSLVILKRFVRTIFARITFDIGSSRIIEEYLKLRHSYTPVHLIVNYATHRLLETQRFHITGGIRQSEKLQCLRMEVFPKIAEYLRMEVYGVGIIFVDICSKFEEVA